jgi:hypothetical protein
MCLNSYMGIIILSFIFQITKEDTILKAEYVKPNFETKEVSKQEDNEVDFEEYQQAAQVKELCVE